jgi:hypothetical protein
LKWSGLSYGFCSKEDRDAKEAVQAGRDCREAAAVDVLTSQGRSVAEAIRSIGISEVTYYR